MHSKINKREDMIVGVSIVNPSFSHNYNKKTLMTLKKSTILPLSYQSQPVKSNRSQSMDYTKIFQWTKVNLTSYQACNLRMWPARTICALRSHILLYLRCRRHNASGACALCSLGHRYGPRDRDRYGPLLRHVYLCWGVIKDALE